MGNVSAMGKVFAFRREKTQELFQEVCDEAMTMFFNLDTNQDGVLTKQEWLNAFDLLDDNMDGVISRKEWSIKNGTTGIFDAIKKSQPNTVKQAEWLLAFDALDTSKDGEISLEEWLAYQKPDANGQCIENDWASEAQPAKVATEEEAKGQDSAADTKEAEATGEEEAEDISKILVSKFVLGNILADTAMPDEPEKKSSLEKAKEETGSAPEAQNVEVAAKEEADVRDSAADAKDAEASGEEEAENISKILVSNFVLSNMLADTAMPDEPEKKSNLDKAKEETGSASEVKNAKVAAKEEAEGQDSAADTKDAEAIVEEDAENISKILLSKFVLSNIMGDTAM